MALPPNEFSIWLPGVPLSFQAKHRSGYLNRIQDAARKVFLLPLLSANIEIVLVFVGSEGHRLRRR